MTLSGRRARLQGTPAADRLTAVGSVSATVDGAGGDDFLVGSALVPGPGPTGVLSEAPTTFIGGPGADVAISRQQRDVLRLRDGQRDRARCNGLRTHPVVDRVEPLARIAGRGVHGVDPDVFGIAPVQAANRALKRAGIGWGDIKAVELNEAFASQSIACLRDWPDLDPELVNMRGGAIAMGHPLGASGARVLGRLAHELRQRGGGYGLAAICIGVGQGLAVVLEA